MIVAFPGATLVTTPEETSTVATNVLLLVQAPPLFPLELKFRADPIQTDEPPLTVPAFKTGFTVTGADALVVAHTLLTV